MMKMAMIVLIAGSVMGVVDAGERNLINNPASAQNSVLSGTTTSTVYAYQNLTLNVQAKDDFGNNITTGGDKFVIEIKNECTVTSNNNLSGNQVKVEYASNINKVWNSCCITDTSISNVSVRFSAYITAPISDTYTFYYTHDNGGALYFNDILKVSNWICSVVTDTFSVNLKALTKYKIVAEMENDGGISQAVLSWSYTGQAKTTVPSSAFYYSQYLTSTPITFSIQSSCGNSVRTINEDCDDGNLNNGDGCNSQCIVEEGYTCTGGSSISIDICSNNLISKNNSDEIISSQILSTIFLSILSIEIILSCVSTLLVGGSVQGTFNLINDVQLILLLPMLAHSMPEYIVDFISNMKYCLFNLSFL